MCVTLVTFAQNQPQIILKARQQDVTGESSNFKVNVVLTLPSSGSASDGKIELLVTGGTEPYTYNWGNDDISDNTLSGLYGSTEYEVLITDATGERMNLYVQLPYQNGEIIEWVNDSEPIFSKVSSLPEDYNYYYISESDYDGSGLGTEEDPWNFSELQDNINSLGENDAVLLKRGDKFKGQLDIGSTGGSYSQPLFIGSYGSGDLPVLTGETSGVLTSAGSNLYTVNIGAQPYIVTVNDKLYEVNKYPKDETYLGVNYVSDTYTIKFANGATTGITNNEFTGDDVLLRLEAWYYDKRVVSSHSDNLYLTSYGFTDGNGWGKDGFVKFYNSDNTKAYADGTYYYKDGILYIYSLNDLTGDTVKVCGNSYGINFTTQTNNVYIRDIDFRYQSEAGIHFFSSDITNRNIDVYQCNFQYIEGAGIEKLKPTTPVVADSSYSVSYCKFKYITEYGISMLSVFNTNISNNYFKHVFWNEYYSDTKYGSGSAMNFITAQHLLINRNRVDSVGCQAVQNTIRDELVNSDIIIEENWFSNCVQIMGDNGAIYTYTTTFPRYINGVLTRDKNILDSLVIRNNFIERVYATPYVYNLKANYGHMVYTDEGSFNHHIHDNLFAHGQQMYFGNQAPYKGDGQNHIDRNYFLDFQHGAEPTTFQSNSLDTLYMNENVFISYHSSDYPMFIGDGWNFTGSFKPSNNIYIDPFNGGANIVDLYGYRYTPNDWSDVPYTYSEWMSEFEPTADVRQVSTSYDMNDYVHYYYNFSDKTIAYILPDGTYMDINGTEYFGTVSIKPYRFAVLFKQ